MSSDKWLRGEARRLRFAAEFCHHGAGALGQDSFFGLSLFICAEGIGQDNRSGDLGFNL